MIKNFLLLAPALILLLFINSCQSENAEDLYKNKPDTTETVTGELAYYSFEDSIIDAKQHTIAYTNKKPKFNTGINESEHSALKLDGSEYLVVDLGKTYDSIAVVFWINNQNDVISGYLPYLIDYGFGYSGARLDLDAVSSATYLYIASDTSSLPAKADMTSEDRVNTRNGWALFYFECTKGHTKTVIKFAHPMLGNLTVSNEQGVPEGTSPATQILTVGKGSNLTGDFNMLVGDIDELHIYNTFLSSKQLNELYKELEN